jgi:thiol-disulfide isomerase/thioredoxin
VQWCGHCQRIAPVWEELGQAFSNDARVTIGEVDCTTSQGTCQDAGVRGYPTLKSFHNGQEVSVHEGERDLPALKRFVISSLQTAGK